MIGKKLLMIGGKAGFPTRKKAGKVMTADHHVHDRKLWERYFKPCLDRTASPDKLIELYTMTKAPISGNVH
jgi:hypothetical protein